MWSLLFGMLRGGGGMGGPLGLCCGLLAGIAAIYTVCQCWTCCGNCRKKRCRLRDWACFKRLFRWTGVDPFDDFELMMLVHEVVCDGGKEAAVTSLVQSGSYKEKIMKGSTVRVIAGIHHVKTDETTNGIFQQPLHIHVEQGTKVIDVHWLDNQDRVLALRSLDVLKDVLEPSVLEEERFYTMRRNRKSINNPRIKLTLGISNDDTEAPMSITGASNDVGDLVRLQLAKARGAGMIQPGQDLSEIQVLKQACAGPLEVFEGLGKTNNVHVAMVGPPASRRWFLGIWVDKDSFDGGKHPITEVDLMRVQSVQADPTRHHVFVINYYDSQRARRILTFRRVDRARDVWVEIMRLMVQQVRDLHENRKRETQQASASMRPTESAQGNRPRAATESSSRLAASQSDGTRSSPSPSWRWGKKD